MGLYTVYPLYEKSTFKAQKQIFVANPLDYVANYLNTDVA